MASEKTTRFLGTCAACGREIKVRGGKLVHHGYERPGYGYIEGDCFGVHYEPHETSPKCAEDCLVSERKRLAGLEEALAGLEGRTELQHRFSRRRVEDVVTVRQGDERVWNEEHRTWVPSFDECLRTMRYQLESGIRQTERSVAHFEGLVASWEAKPLRSVEEEKAAKREAQEAKKAEKARIKAEKEAAKAARREKMLANRQARLDKAVAKLKKDLDAAIEAKSPVRVAYEVQEAVSKLQDLSSDWWWEPGTCLKALGHETLLDDLGVMTGDPEYPRRRYYDALEVLRTLKAWPL